MRAPTRTPANALARGSARALTAEKAPRAPAQLAGVGFLLCLAGCGSGPQTGVAAEAVGSAEVGSTQEAGWPESFGLGRTATAQEIATMDVDVMPDGRGLPPGSGSVPEGEAVYRASCAACHGATGVEGPNDRLVGREPREGFPFGVSTRYRGMRTVGSYWPYATTLFDYIGRAMPQTAPGSLTADQIYAVSAYLLFLNQIVPAEAVMDARTLPEVVMPARDRFVVDNRRGGPEIR